MLLSVCYIKCIVAIQVFVEPQNLIDLPIMITPLVSSNFSHVGGLLNTAI
jgi:hypothetical protein